MGIQGANALHGAYLGSDLHGMIQQGFDTHANIGNTVNQFHQDMLHGASHAMNSLGMDGHNLTGVDGSLRPSLNPQQQQQEQQMIDQSPQVMHANNHLQETTAAHNTAVQHEEAINAQHTTAIAHQTETSNKLADLEKQKNEHINTQPNVIEAKTKLDAATSAHTAAKEAADAAQKASAADPNNETLKLAASTALEQVNTAQTNIDQATTAHNTEIATATTTLAPELTNSLNEATVASQNATENVTKLAGEKSIAEENTKKLAADITTATNEHASAIEKATSEQQQHGLDQGMGQGMGQGMNSFGGGGGSGSGGMGMGEFGQGMNNLSSSYGEHNGNNGNGFGEHGGNGGGGGGFGEHGGNGGGGGFGEHGGNGGGGGGEYNSGNGGGNYQGQPNSETETEVINNFVNMIVNKARGSIEAGHSEGSSDEVMGAGNVFVENMGMMGNK